MSLKNEKGNDGHGNDMVIIKIDGVDKLIHRGSHTVAEIKELTEVAPVDKLATMRDGVLVTLRDDERITIKGGESFRVVPGGGQSS